MKKKIFKFVIDGVNKENIGTLRKAIAQVPQITGFDYKPMASMLVVESPSNPTASIELACQVAGVRFRGQVKT